MIPALTYEEVCKFLNDGNFRGAQGFPNWSNDKTKTIGFILFNQNFSQDSAIDIIANLDLLNERAGSAFHFFICGVSRYGTTEDGARPLGELKGVHLFHNAKCLMTFVEAFSENINNWNYNMGCEIILIDVNEIDNVMELQFDTAVYFKIDELIKADIISSPTDLFGKIIRFSEQSKLLSARSFKDELQSTFGANWIKGLLLGMLPSSIGKLARAQAALGGGAALPK